MGQGDQHFSERLKSYMTSMADMPIYGNKTLRFFCFRTKRLTDFLTFVVIPSPSDSDVP